MTIPRVSIVLVTRNGMDTLPAVFDAIARQKTALSFEVIAVDSSSTDGTRALLASRADEFATIRASEFNHGTTRNMAVERARGEFVILLTQDAVPVGDNWLDALVSPLVNDSTLAGTFARQVARPDASGVARYYLGHWVAAGTVGHVSGFGSRQEFDALTPVERLRRTAFDNVCSCIRRSVWERHPFQAVPIAEDLAWAREVMLASHRVAFVPEAVVVHSHDRPLGHELARTRALHDQLFTLFGLRTIPGWLSLARAVAASSWTHVRCEASSPARLPRALALAVVWPLGQYLGGRDAFTRDSTRGRDSTCERDSTCGSGFSRIESGERKRVLVVTHEFPPDAHGGAGVYAHAHARELVRQGEQVLVLTRDRDPGRPDYHVRRTRVDGLDVMGINNLFRGVRTFAESYANPAIDDVAAGIIDDYRPDVAHVHHLTCLSTGIVHLLANRRIPVVLTAHDYWLFCHRGQLIDRNGDACHSAPEMCASCLGPEAGIAPAGYTAARVVRALEKHVPVAGALRRMAPLASNPECVNSEARARTEHMRALLERVNHVFVPADHLRDLFLRSGLPGERVSVSPYGFARGLFTTTPRTSGKVLRIGYLGSLTPAKAPHVLLGAFANLEPGSATLDIFGAHTTYHGDDSYRERLTPLLEQAGIRVHGAIQHDRVPEALSTIDVLVVPSVWPETSPLVIREAFMAGVPVIASRIGGIPEAVEHETSGLLFEPGDVAGLRTALQRCIEDPSVLDALRNGAPEVRSIEDDVRSTRAVYERERNRIAGSRVAAVVLNYRTPDDTRLAVQSLLRSRQRIDDVIVVDNDASGGCRESLAACGGEVMYVPTHGNLGYAGGMNVGVRTALARGADRVFLVNSDVIVPPGCLDALERARVSTGAAIVGPVVVTRSAPDRLQSLGLSYHEATGRMRLRGHGLRADVGRVLWDPPSEPGPKGPGLHPGHFESVDAVAGCAMLVDRMVFDRVGVFHEPYFFGFEDLDLCLAARRAGLKTVLARDAAVYHEGSRSIGAASPRRLYFAARNHLLAAHRAAPHASPLTRFGRALSVTALNLAHAARPAGGSVGTRLVAVMRGTRDYAVGRFGPGA